MDITESKLKMALLAKKFNLKLIVLFGSQVTGRVHSESDYDIAYLSKDDLSFRQEGQFILDLMPILKIKDERLIHLVNLKTNNPVLSYSALRQGQVLFEREAGTFLSFRLYVWKLFVDSKLFRDNCFRIIKERVLTM